MKHYELALLGPVSEDHNIEPNGEEAVELGGAIMYSPYAAVAGGAQAIALVKANPSSHDVKGAYADLRADLRILPSRVSTSIRNQYLDASHEQRVSSMISQADPFTEEDIADIEADIFHLGGLIYGDFSDEFILTATRRGKVALDAQCLLRHGDKATGKMDYKDWPGKREVLPHIHYLKVDAKEAQILTGTEDREKAARELHAMGAKEVFISFHNQMLVFDGSRFYTCDYKTRSTIGRTGRGDTVFAAYLAKRHRGSIEEALLFSTALVCLKMEKRGPFRGTLQDIEDFIREMQLKVEVR